MTRCSKCILPSTLPNSNFDKNGECYWCQTNYPNYNPIGAEKFQEVINKYRGKSQYSDCLVGVSGGKDSCYILTELKETYNLRVEAFTYIHGASSTHSLENAKKICKALDIKHHIVSLPNNSHLATFKTFYSVWEKSPTLISANMGCVACKHLHTLGYKLAKERNIPMLVWGHCPLEVPPILAIKSDSSKERGLYRTGLLTNSLSLMKEMINNFEFTKGFFKHFNICVEGCLSISPDSKYLRMRFPSIKSINFYDYIEWNPLVILKKLESKGWIKPDNDWHSDCLISTIKDYQFKKTSGIIYLEAFLSNQIRAGLISRDDALAQLKLKEKSQCDLEASLRLIGI